MEEMTAMAVPEYETLMDIHEVVRRAPDGGVLETRKVGRRWLTHDEIESVHEYNVWPCHLSSDEAEKIYNEGGTTLRMRQS